MKYVITGAAGNISKPLAEKLLKAGHEVTVISRQEKNIESLISQGAQAAIGSVEDIDFLTNTCAIPLPMVPAPMTEILVIIINLK